MVNNKRAEMLATEYQALRAQHQLLNLSASHYCMNKKGQVGPQLQPTSCNII